VTARNHHPELGPSGGRAAGTHSPELDAVFPEVYDELRHAAAALLRGERKDHTLEPTGLVHEAYLKLSRRDLGELSRPQVLAIGARAMRQILVDHARARQRDKRGGKSLRVTLAEGLAVTQPTWDILALDQALENLAALDERQERIIELRFLGGLTIEEIAELLSISPATVKRDSTVAQAWLFRALQGA
jgi:RNA polymerase sigma-70 factor (ECF subfamily)